MAQIYGIIRIGDRLMRKKCVEGLLVAENKKGYAFVTYPSSFWASCRIRTNDPEITNHVLWPTELKRQMGKRSTSRRYNQVPLLRSSPGGFRGSMPCRTYPGAKVAVFSFLPNNLGIVCGILRISDWHSLDFMHVKECLSFGSLLRK